MNEHQHPDQALLDAYMHQPDADEFSMVGLHLLRCRECRDQVSMTMLLKQQYTALDSDPMSDEQQAVVDDFLYAENDPQARLVLQQSIHKDPRLLKSVLYSLSQQFTEAPALRIEQSPVTQQKRPGWITRLSEWLQWHTASWASVAVAVMITLVAMVILLQPQYFGPKSESGISIASFRDEQVIRFYPSQQLPGIGFFTGASHSTRSYEGMQVSLNAQQLLELNWQAVDNATAYQLSLYRYARGEKKLLESVTTTNTRMQYPLQTEDYNHRFEWVLSGQTVQHEKFVTSGGFVVSQPLQQGDS